MNSRISKKNSLQFQVERLEERTMLSAVPQLIDLNQNEIANSAPNEMVEANGLVFFPAWDPQGGVELWKSDGTDAGTVRVKDIRPGTGSSLPGNLTKVGSELFFTVRFGSRIRELWKTDGTESGTVVVKEFYEFFGREYPVELIAGNDELFFTTDRGLWKSNGTEVGTMRVKELNNVLGYPDSSYLSNVDGTIYFVAEGEEEKGFELWRSDGTTDGTVLVRDINPGPNSSDPYSFENVNGSLFFSANDGVNGHELWKSDGTESGTVIVRDIETGSEGSYPQQLLNAGENLFFSTFGSNARGLWKSDGTSVGTELFAETGFSPVMDFQGDLVFTGRFGLSITDGTESGTTLLSRVSAIRLEAVALDSHFLFSADTIVESDSGHELWVSDGTADGTELLVDILPGVQGSEPKLFTRFGNSAFFVANDSSTGWELWQSDGTQLGTKQVHSFSNPIRTESSFPTEITDADSRLFFTATGGVNTGRLFTSENGPEEIVQVKDVYPFSGTEPVNDTVFFRGTLLPDFGGDLIFSDGTRSGTHQLKIRDDDRDAFPSQMTRLGDEVIFRADDGIHGTELWKSDGTEEGTVLVRDINPGPGTSLPLNLKELGGEIFFAAKNSDNSGSALWKSDGTADGTSMIKDIYPGGDAYPREFTAVNGEMFFNSNSPNRGRELWKTDGTESGTILVRDIRPGDGHSSPYFLTNLNGTLYFFATGPTGRGLWKSDGTEQGTVAIRNFSDASWLMDAGDSLFFIVNQFELWKSDGTTNGTVLVKDFTDAGLKAQIRDLIDVNGALFFPGYDPIHGRELWMSDGTPEGTKLVADLAPGTADSNPEAFTLSGQYLYFAAEHPDAGEEMWALVFPTSDELEPNDLSSSATVLDPAQKTYGQLSIHSVGDEDWYSWTADASGEFSVETRFRQLDGDLSLEIYDSNLVRLGFGNSQSDNELISTNVVSGETYFIRVFGDGDATNAYTLNVSTLVADSIRVTNVNDSGPGSLRQAIVEANGRPGADRIEFEIGGGNHTILLDSELPVVSDPLEIDGFTQIGSSPNTLENGNDAEYRIVLDGRNSIANGLWIDTSQQSTIQGLVVQNFEIGIGVSGVDSVISQNVLGSNSVAGIHVDGARISLQGNLVGIDAVGNALGNGVGIRIQSDGNLVGGSEWSERNVVSNNTDVGILIEANAAGNQVAGNYVGTNLTGNRKASVQQTHGILLDGGATQNQIGPANVIAGNLSGVAIRSESAVTNYNRIERNTFHNNQGLPIDLYPLGPTPNDVGDFDRGANDRLNRPEHLRLMQLDANRYLVRTELQYGPANSFPIHIDFYESDADGQEISNYLGTFACENRGDCRQNEATNILEVVFVTTTLGDRGSDFVIAHAMDDLGNTSEFSNATRVRSIITAQPAGDGLNDLNNLVAENVDNRICDEVVLCASNTQSWNANIHTFGDVDVYEVTIPARAGQVLPKGTFSAELRFAHQEGDLDLDVHLIDNGEPRLLASSSGKSDVERVAFPVTVDQTDIRDRVFYVVVHGFLGDVNETYELTVHFDSTDEDIDGLLLDWEMNQRIPFDGGQINFDTKPQRGMRDLFVEYDWMQGQEPRPWTPELAGYIDTNFPRVRPLLATIEALKSPDSKVQLTNTVLDLVIAAYWEADTNEDGITDPILLHLQRDEQVPANLGDWTWDVNTRGPKPFANWNEFTDLDYFGRPNSTERFHANWRTGDNPGRLAKKKGYRYAFFGYELEDSENLGRASIKSNDFVITLGEEGDDPHLYALRQASVFMHELGHTLGLEHGGVDDTHFKPNYVSVMNYHWVLPDLINSASWSLDYSRYELPVLDKRNLGTQGIACADDFHSANDPIHADAFASTYDNILIPIGPPLETGGVFDLIQAHDCEVDWNDQNGQRDINRVLADMNDDLVIDESDEFLGPDLLLGHNDWSNLLFQFTYSEVIKQGDAPDQDGPSACPPGGYDGSCGQTGHDSPENAISVLSDIIFDQFDLIDFLDDEIDVGWITDRILVPGATTWFEIGATNLGLPFVGAFEVSIETEFDGLQIINLDQSGSEVPSAIVPKQQNSFPLRAASALETIQFGIGTSDEVLFPSYKLQIEFTIEDQLATYRALKRVVGIGNTPAFDVTGDTYLDEEDLNVLVQDVFKTKAGDSNFDGKFSPTDLIVVFQAGEYEDNIPDNSTWDEGDWNFDGEFDTSDLIVGFQSGGYVAAATAATSTVFTKEMVAGRVVAGDYQLSFNTAFWADKNAYSIWQQSNDFSSELRIRDPFVIQAMNVSQDHQQKPSLSSGDVETSLWERSYIIAQHSEILSEEAFTRDSFQDAVEKE